jgi:hypothetical protein
MFSSSDLPMGMKQVGSSGLLWSFSGQFGKSPCDQLYWDLAVENLGTQT